MGKDLGININLYDFNKAGMAQLKPYDPIMLARECKEVADDLWENEKPSYWMLLCRERNDYTIFRIYQDCEELKNALIECLNNRGGVLDIKKQEDGNYEIWIRDFYTEENVVYYLFDYNNALVEV